MGATLYRETESAELLQLQDTPAAQSLAVAAGEVEGASTLGSCAAATATFSSVVVLG